MSKIAQVIPAVRLKRSLNYFDYLIPEELSDQIKIGQVVEIPFRNQLIRGVVFSLSDKSASNYELKPINTLVDPLPYLSNWQLALIKFMADYYFVSMAMVLKMVLPEIPKRKANISNEMKFKFTDDILEKVNLPDLSSAKPLLMAYSDKRQKISAYIQIIKANILQNKQTVIIVPALINIEQICQYFGDFKDSISIFLNDLSKNKLWQEWQKIKSGQAKVIIGTRSAIFAPFDSLGTIIIDEENNPNHKQEEPNPRYNAKTVALKIGELTQAKVIFSALTPSLNSLYEVQTKAWDYFELAKPIELPQIAIIDRQDEFKKGNYKAFSEKLQLSIESNLQQNKKTFLFLNRKGSATLVSCKDCGYIASCPTCHLPLTYYKKSGILLCQHCNYKTDLFIICPKCQSHEIKITGLGTEKAESDLQKLYPQAKIVMIDQENRNEAKIKEAEIIIGTQYAFDFIDWQEIQTIGVLNADTLLYLPDYRSSERTFNLLKQLILAIPDKQKEFLVQTMTPDNYIFSALKQLDLKSFYQREIKERKDLHYPPFSKLIKLVHQSVDFNGGEEEITEIYKNLKSRPKDDQPLADKVESYNNVVINPPALAYTQQVRGRFRWQIIIKLLNLKVDTAFLEVLPENLIIDVDPENLL